MVNKNFPCKYCNNRAMNCHSYCEDYNKAKADYEKEKEEERLYSDIDRFLVYSTIERISKSNHKKIYIQKNYID